MKILLIIGLLWSYALIAGLSASVVRASMMFTVFAIGMNLKRPANTYNTLAISMFILLLLKPNFLLDVGFQLSYLAVLSIITIVPMLTTWWSPKNKLLNFFWRILAVTISAQIGVLPLSLYYFHQFPGLFFVSNLVIIPLLGFILCFGLLVVLLASLNCLPEFLISIYAVIIDVMNAFVQLVSAQETFLFQNIPFDLGLVILSYLLIGATILYFKNRRFKHLLSVLVMIISFQTFIIYKKYTSAGFEFILFHKSRHTIIGERYGNTMTIYHNLNEPLKNQNIIINYKVGQAIKEVRSDSLKNVFDISGKKLLLIDSLGVYITTFKPEFVLLTNSPKINLVRLIDSLQPELILSDGSNYRTYQERWKLTCEAKKIPFHQTGEKGAFIISY